MNNIKLHKYTIKTKNQMLLSLFYSIYFFSLNDYISKNEKEATKANRKCRFN